MAKLGLVSQNGVDYYPEEFMSDLKKGKKKKKNNHDGKLKKIDKINNMPTAFHSEINVEAEAGDNVNQLVNNNNNQQINSLSRIV